MIKSWVAGFKRPSRETRYGDTQVFIDTKNNICFIVDGGDGECASRLISYLKQNNISKVYILLTHPHSDHGDGLRKIIKDSFFTVLYFYCYDPDSLKEGLRNNRGSAYVWRGNPNTIDIYVWNQHKSQSATNVVIYATILCITNTFL